ncbi:MAG: glutaredoxin 3 [Caulobacteraceae bacterium]
MAQVTIYTRPFCGYCARALGLLGDKGVAFTEIEAGFDPEKRREMFARSGATTFPQIFVGESHVGGCDELLELDRQGRLDGLLAG